MRSRRSKCNQASRDYVSFQQKYGVLDVATQVSEMSKSLAAVQSQLTAKQLELRVAARYCPATDPRIVKLKAEIQQLEQMQKEVREGSPGYGTGGVAQKDLPGGAPVPSLKREWRYNSRSSVSCSSSSSSRARGT